MNERVLLGLIRRPLDAGPGVKGVNPVYTQQYPV